MPYEGDFLRIEVKYPKATNSAPYWTDPEFIALKPIEYRYLGDIININYQVKDQDVDDTVSTILVWPLSN